MFSQATPPPIVSALPPENLVQEQQQDGGVKQLDSANLHTSGTLSPPETLPSQFSSDGSAHIFGQENLGKGAVTNNTGHEESVQTPISGNDSLSVESTPVAVSGNDSQWVKSIVAATPENNLPAPTNIPTNTPTNTQTISAPTPQNTQTNTINESAKTEFTNLLLAVIINNREVGSLEVLQSEKNLLLPLADFATIAGFTVESVDNKTQLKTPAGVVTLSADELKIIKGVTYISDEVLREKLATNLKLNSGDLALNVDLPWRRQSQNRTEVVQLQPEVKPSGSGLTNVRQELTFFNNSGDTSWRSSTLLGGRLAGGTWRLRLNNDFVDRPELTEYFFLKRTGQFLYQIGRQQISLHPLLNGVNTTGLQVGFSNLPRDKFTSSLSASELLPRRSQPVQTFRGVVEPASFVQLRVGGSIFAQQQVGLSGEYEFLDVNLSTGRLNDIEIWVFDRNNLNTPKEIRSVKLSSSDLLLPPGGNVQLAGVGFSGNSLQDAFFEESKEKNNGVLVGFYQLRQGITNNLTLEGSVQLLPDNTQGQAGFIWRLANPLVLASSVGSSNGKLGYTTDLDFQLDRFLVTGKSEIFSEGYFSSSQTRERQNHYLEAKYEFSNSLELGLIARKFQDQSDATSYVLPTFSLRPVSGLFLNGRPDTQGKYLFNAFYQPSQQSRLSFSAFGDTYSTDLSYNFSPEYGMSFGTESGGDLATRFTLSLNRSARSLSGLSWRLGLGYREGEVGAIVGANMQVLPGLLARVEYQGIPSKNKNIFGGFGDDRLTVSLVSDLSFAGGRISPANYTSIGRDTGAIAGRIVVDGGRRGFNLSESTVQVINAQGRTVGSTITDSQGNFFVGNLREGVYVVQIDPEGLPVELALKKTAVVAEVASSAVTKLDFPVTLEYGLAGRVTDATGQPIPELEVELVNTEGKKISTSATDEFGLYRLDGVPAGKYLLQIPTQEGITNNEGLPKRDVTIDGEFLFDQNLQLPITPTVKEDKESVTAQ